MTLDGVAIAGISVMGLVIVICILTLIFAKRDPCTGDSAYVPPIGLFFFCGASVVCFLFGLTLLSVSLIEQAR